MEGGENMAGKAKAAKRKVTKQERHPAKERKLTGAAAKKAKKY